jgi:hypothetical protein
MLHFALGLVAFAPALVLGWKLRAIAALVGCKLDEQMPHPQKKMFLLVFVPSTLFVVFWAAGISLLLLEDFSLASVIKNEVAALVLAFWAVGVAMCVRRDLPKTLETLMKQKNRA